ncbi:MAG: MFS transporter [Phycisphaerae bacterium]|jgi:MFS family permease
MEKMRFANTGLGSIFRSLKYRNYRLFFSGQSLSLIGTWMQRIAASWLAYRLSDSALILGVVSFSGQIPSFILAPLGGLVADRYSKHRILVLTQILSMLQALVLSLLVLTGKIQIWHLALLSAMLGIINAFDMPTRQAFVVEMLEDQKDLGNAIALNSSMVNGARLLGPSIAGILIAVTGEGICFLLNAISYLAVIISLLMMKLKPYKIQHAATHPLHQLKDAFVYSFGFAPIRYIILLLAIVSFTGMPYAVLMPVFARDILHGDSSTLGFLMGASGIGALTAALYLASRKTVLGLGKMLVVATLTFGASLMIFAISKSLWLSMPMLFFAGAGMMINLAACNTILQTMVDDDKRGRVMSIFAMAFMGMVPFGSLIAGASAHRYGAGNTLLVGGLFCIAGGLSFSFKLPLIRKMVRPIYIKKGIIPETGSAIHTAAELNVPPER